MKRIISAFLAILFTVPMLITTSYAEENSEHDLEKVYTAIDSILKWKNSGGNIIDDDLLENVGVSVNDWFAFSVGRLGKDESFDEYINAAENFVNSGSTEITTDLQRVSLAVTACGGDSMELGLIDKAVFEKISNDNLSEQTINVLIFSLLTLDSLRFEIPDNLNLTRSAIITEILQSRSDSGAFIFNGAPDTDITAMAVQALSPYYNCEEIFSTNSGDVTAKEAIDSAIDYLSTVQQDDGDMISWGAANCESTAQTIVALCSAGINPLDDGRFIKNGNTLVDGLFKYSMDDGGFAHTLTGENDSSNAIATVQTLYSLCALCRLENDYRTLYDMRAENGEISENAEKLTLADDIASADYSVGEPIDVAQKRTAAPSDEVIGTSDTAAKPLETSGISSETESGGNSAKVIEITVLCVILAAAVIIKLVIHKRKSAKGEDK